jgi:hypothetical protein
LALNVAIALSTASITPPQAVYATLVVYNPNALGVSVTNVQLICTPLGATTEAIGGNFGVVPIGPGTTTLCPALGTITIGPFPLVQPSLANGGTFYLLNNESWGSSPANAQGALPLQQNYQVNALVYGSDLSVNTAAPASFLVSYIPPPPVGTMGGVLQLNNPSNSLGAFGIGWP